MFSSLLFIIILGFAAVSYSGYYQQYQLSEKKAELESSAISISQTLVKSNGFPADWENDASRVEVLGLAETENILSIEKVRAFDSIPYNETGELLGIPGDYYIEIRSADGDLIFSKGDAKANASSVSIERIVYLDQKFSRMVIRLYEG